MSPLVDGERLIAYVGGDNDGELAAFDVKTGASVWSWKGDGPGYASPVVATWDGVRQVVTQSQNALVGSRGRLGRAARGRSRSRRPTSRTPSPRS